MSEQRTQQSSSSSAGGRTALQSDRGNTTIQDSVVSKIAGIAASEVDGVRMGGGTSQTVGNLLGSITGGSGGSGSPRPPGAEAPETRCTAMVRAARKMCGTKPPSSSPTAPGSATNTT